MASISFFEQQHTPDITHTPTKLTKLITALPILYYFQILSNGYSLNAACDAISNFLQQDKRVDEKIQLKDE